MEPREPWREQVVPSSNHWQTCVRREIEAKTRKIIRQKQQNRYRHDDLRCGHPCKTHPQSLRYRSDQVHRIGRDKRENCTCAENIEDRHKRHGQKNRTREMPNRVARLSGKNRRVFEPTQRAKRHLAEDTKAEESERRKSEL